VSAQAVGCRTLIYDWEAEGTAIPPNGLPFGPDLTVDDMGTLEFSPINRSRWDAVGTEFVIQTPPVICCGLVGDGVANAGCLSANRSPLTQNLAVDQKGPFAGRKVV